MFICVIRIHVLLFVCVHVHLQDRFFFLFFFCGVALNDVRKESRKKQRLQNMI